MKIDTLDTEFKTKIETLLKAAEGATGRVWVVTDARRTMKEQQAIYAQGRTTPGKVVSNARAGSSAHNYGLAADIAPLKLNSKLIDWNADKDIWQAMAGIAKEMGLIPGFYFRTIFDAPHVEDPKWKEQQALWKAGKIEVA